jgi:M6 family metalloprotease-like protein
VNPWSLLRCLVWIGGGCALGFSPLEAFQDVEWLGEIHGTTPPAGYRAQLERTPDAFRFEVEGRARLEQVRSGLRGRSFRQELLLRESATSASLGPHPRPLAGTFSFPLVLGSFQPDGSPPPRYTRERIQEEYFDGPNANGLTLSGYWDEVSRGLLRVRGATSDWVATMLTPEEVTLGQSALVADRNRGMGAFVEAVVAGLEAQGMDWSPYDADGDGFVDLLAILHPTQGAECGGAGSAARIWSHRWNVRSASMERLNPGIRTSTLRPDGRGFLYINDYIVQPVLACDGEDINAIGVFAHELGHAFGLPDLYGTLRLGSRHTGSGNWDLMGTGTWGCGFARNPSRPCHLGAWSQAMLGWLSLEEVLPGVDYGEISLPPISTSGRALWIPSGDGSGEYLLVENRQRTGSQGELFEPGLLIWQVDPEGVEARWGTNTVNVDPSQMGVRLREADGGRDLAQSGGERSRGSPGHPFPGCALDRWQDYFSPPWDCRRHPDFHITSPAPAIASGGRALGVALTGIQVAAGGAGDVRFRLSTRLQRDTLQIERTLEAAREHDVRLGEGGGETVRWRLQGGTLPPGIRFEEAEGRLVGLPMELGRYPFELWRAEGALREVIQRVDLRIGLPSVPDSTLVGPFLRGRGGPEGPLLVFLDRLGNRDGGYDLGDLRAFLQAAEGAP